MTGGPCCDASDGTAGKAFRSYGGSSYPHSCSIATTDADGNCDVGPKGGPPGFVKVLDDTHLGWADLSGYNRLDGMQNLITSNGIALVFLVLGVSEVLRVNGRATITTDPTTAQCVAIGRSIPHVSIVCEVEAAWLHCGKALRRSSIWDNTKWPDTSRLASYGQIIKDHSGLHAVTAEALDAVLHNNYETHQWLPGGGDPYRDAGPLIPG